MDCLIQRLRAAAQECSAWDINLNPPYTSWSDLLDEAADAIASMPPPDESSNA